MTSKSTSKWATEDDEETAAVLAQRKREKEEKKRLREEKARKAAAAPASLTSNDQAADGSERPSKRQRTSPEQENGAQAQAPASEEAANLLQFPARQFGPCGHVDQYDLLNNIEEGSYGFVSRGRRKTSGDIVALKRLKMEHTNDGFPVTGLREIQTLMACRHTNVVRLLEVVMGDSLKE